MKRHSDEYKKCRACWELTHSEGWPYIEELIRTDAKVGQIGSLDEAFQVAAALSRKDYAEATLARIERLSTQYTNCPVTN